MPSPNAKPDTTGRYAESVDRTTRAMIAEATQGIAPSALMTAWADWAIHMVAAPGTQTALWERAAHDAGEFAQRALRVSTGGDGENGDSAPRADDRRFRAEGWQAPPFSLMRDAFLTWEGWWDAATTGVRGVSPENEKIVNFATRQMLDVFSPSNNPALNPEVLAKTRETAGMNFVKGALHMLEDLSAPAGEATESPPQFKLGEGLATAPGKVVARNHLMELIQYSPTTDTVHPEPVLITPAWIMKYYILDLSPHNSLVRWLVDQGFTVFMISWRNPGPEDRDLGMDDYLDMGPLAALDAVQAITGADRVHGVGYCLGGTLLAIAAAAMTRRGDERLASLSLFAAQTDFSEAGELRLFISESQIALLEDMMWRQGYLDSSQMAGAFTMLRSNDLLWSRMVREYMMGERPDPIDLMVWNADTTRMPARMHSEYLRWLFLENRLTFGKYEVHGRKVSLTDLRLPILAVGTETDHVAPWKSVFKIQRLTETETTFILTNGGHNAGIVSEPGHKRRHYRIATTHRDDCFIDADAWYARNAPEPGSWWPAWGAWLAQRSGARTAPPPLGNARAGLAPLCDAPGTYVLQD